MCVSASTRSISTGLTELYITNLTNKNAVIYTNEGNFDLRQTRQRAAGVRCPRFYGIGKAQANNEEGVQDVQRGPRVPFIGFARTAQRRSDCDERGSYGNPQTGYVKSPAAAPDGALA